jgi:Ca-activated chloride channel family protein
MTMDSQAQNPDRPPDHLQELEPHLRQAVEQVRSQTAPAGAEAKALEQAHTLPRPAAPRRGWSISPALACACLTAMLLLGFGVGMWAGQRALSPEREGTPEGFALLAKQHAKRGELEKVEAGRSVDRATIHALTTDPKDALPVNKDVHDRIEEVAVPGRVIPANPVGSPEPTSGNQPPTVALVISPDGRTPPGRSGATKDKALTDLYDGERLAELKQIVGKQERIRVLTLQSQKNSERKAEEKEHDPAKPDAPGEAKPQPALLPPPARGETEGVESYSHFQDNPFLDVLNNPLSTFSSSVDTASFSNVRRFLTQDGRLPPPDAVRVAEMINYFPYTYAQPKGNAPVSFTVDIADCPWQKKHHLLRIAMKGKELSAAEMPPRNFVFLIDTSGSMLVDNRLPLLKKSLAMLTEQLTAKDRVAMVAYAGSAGLVLDSTPGDQKDKILGALGRLEAGGSTNGGDGIRLAYKVAVDNFMKEGINRVILGTDGDFNVGTTSEGDLVRLIEEKRQTGVYLTILGYGIGNLKDATLEKLATHGKGHYAYIDSEAEARKVFVEQGASLVTIAKDVKLQVEFNPQMVVAYRLIGYENRLLRAEDFNDDQKHAGDIGTGHTVTALYEIVPAAKAAPKNEVDPLKYQQRNALTEAASSGEWLTVKMRYKDPDADTSKLLTQPMAGAPGAFDKMPEDFRFAAAVAAFGQMLRSSEYKGEMTWAAVREVAASSLGKDEQGHRKAFLDMVQAAEKLAPKAQDKK